MLSTNTSPVNSDWWPSLNTRIRAWKLCLISYCLWSLHALRFGNSVPNQNPNLITPHLALLLSPLSSSFSIISPWNIILLLIHLFYFFPLRGITPVSLLVSFILSELRSPAKVHSVYTGPLHHFQNCLAHLRCPFNFTHIHILSSP